MIEYIALSKLSGDVMGRTSRDIPGTVHYTHYTGRVTSEDVMGGTSLDISGTVHYAGSTHTHTHMITRKACTLSSFHVSDQYVL